MIAASFWSLLAPGIEMAEDLGQNAWMTAAIGFLSGRIVSCFWLISCCLICTWVLRQLKREGVKTSWQRSILLVLAITLHNIPEGLAVGVAFGAVAYGLPSSIFRRCYCFGNRHWITELSGRGSSLNSSEKRRVFTKKSIFIWSGVWYR